MRSVLVLALLLVGCSKAHRPSKADAADAVHCKRSGVEISETLENTWTDEDGVLRMRARVGVSCTKPLSADAPPMDLWQECRWVEGDWECGPWRSGTAKGGPRERAPSTIYMKPGERGRAESH